jgi:hypothetical protein
MSWYCLGHLPNVITEAVETAKNRVHILKGTREFGLSVFISFAY